MFPFHLFVITYTAGERYITSGDVKEHKTIVDYFLASDLYIVSKNALRIYVDIGVPFHYEQTVMWWLQW